MRGKHGGGGNEKHGGANSGGGAIEKGTVPIGRRMRMRREIEAAAILVKHHQEQIDGAASKRFREFSSAEAKVSLP
jgi:hypothetical protein